MDAKAACVNLAGEQCTGFRASTREQPAAREHVAAEGRELTGAAGRGGIRESGWGQRENERRGGEKRRRRENNQCRGGRKLREEKRQWGEEAGVGGGAGRREGRSSWKAAHWGTPWGRSCEGWPVETPKDALGRSLPRDLTAPGNLSLRSWHCIKELCVRLFGCLPAS